MYWVSKISSISKTDKAHNYTAVAHSKLLQHTKKIFKVTTSVVAKSCKEKEMDEER